MLIYLADPVVTQCKQLNMSEEYAVKYYGFDGADDTEGEYPEGTIAVISCNTCYILTGEPVIECLSNGWSEMLPTCGNNNAIM